MGVNVTSSFGKQCRLNRFFFLISYSYICAITPSQVKTYELPTTNNASIVNELILNMKAKLDQCN